MKKFTVLGLLFLAVLVAIGVAEPNTTVFKRMATAVTNLNANATSSNASTTVELYHAETPVRVYVTASGIAATTNGSFIVYIATSYNSNTWDTARLSNIKVTMSELGATTNTVSDWFQTGGAKYLRVGWMENTFEGAVSNINVTIAMPAP